MVLQSIRPLLIAAMVGSISFAAVAAQTAAPPRSNVAPKRVEGLLQALAAGKKLEGDLLDLIPALIAIVESGETQDSELAMRALAGMGAKARAAIAAISKKLGDPTHATRSTAADALVAIGDKCVVPVRKLLNSPTARTRASAAHVLSRMKKLELNQLAKLARDSDPRVRAVAANALSRFGKPGVPQLADMLQDPDLAVAVEAAAALRSNCEDAAIAIPRLIQVLSRADLGPPAAAALAAYGIAARQAIPALIKAHPLGRGNSTWYDAAEEALQHIGPPDVADIPQICENLARDGETRMVVARNLGLLGLKAKSAAKALEAAAQTSFEEHARRMRLPKAKREVAENSDRVFLAGEECAIAVWNVTHDTPRFLHLVERLVIAANGPILNYFSRQPVLLDLSLEDCRLIEKMLRHANIDVRQTALAVLADAGPKGEPLKKVLLELAQGRNAELSHKAIDGLAAIGAKAGNESAPVLLAKFRDGTIPLSQFAHAAGRLGIRSEAVRAILERGLHDKDRRTAIACATAVCMTSNQPNRTARLVIDASRDGILTVRDVIEAFYLLKGGDDTVIPFLVEQLQNSDYWTYHDAINALGSFGRNASRAVTPLEKLLADKSSLIRLRAAAAIFLISNKPAALEKELQAAFATDDRVERSQGIKAITDLKHAGRRLIRYVLAELRRSPPIFAEEAITALQAIGTEDAVAALRETAESSDWLLRSLATKALQHIRGPAVKGGE
jgi:HEAT repeat protein